MKSQFVQLFRKKVQDARLGAFFLLFLFSLLLMSPASAAAVPKILHHQGRLLSAAGSLLGGTSGTSYCFRFSIHDNTTVGSGSQLWPASTPSTMTITVTNGVYNAYIGDTIAGGDELAYNFQDNEAIYLQVQVAEQVSSSCSGVSFETVEPRQRIVSSGFALNAGSVVGTNSSAVGTTTPITGAVLSVVASSSSATPLIVRATSSQSADLLSIQNVSGSGLVFVNASGGVFASSTLQVTGAATVYGALRFTSLASCDTIDTDGDGNLVCGSDAGGVFGGGTVNNAISISNGTVTSTIRANGLFVATSTSNLLGLFSVDASGNISSSGTLRVVALSTLTGGFLSSASSSIGSSLNVSGNFNASSSVFVSGLSTLTGGFLSAASSSIGSSLNVVGNLNASSSFFVSSLSTLTGGFISSASSSIGSSLNISGNLNASSSVLVDGLAKFNVGFISAASSSFGSSVTVSGGLSASNTVYIGGQLSASSTVLVTGLTTLYGGIISTASTSIGAPLTVTGPLNASSTLLVRDSIMLNPAAGTFDLGRFYVDSSGNLNASGTIKFSNLAGCDTIDSDANGVLSCGTDSSGGGSFGGGTITSALSVTNGTVTSSIRADGLFVATSTSNMLGLFSVDASGNISSSGTLSIVGASILTGGFTSRASSTVGGLLTVSNNLSTSGTLFAAGGLILNMTDGTFNQGRFYVDTSGNVTASGTLGVVGLSTLTGGFNSLASSTVGAALTVSGQLHASTTLQITATTTHYSDLVLDGRVLNRALFVQVSPPSGTIPRGIQFVTTTVDGPGQGPLLTMYSTTTGELDYGRIGINTSTSFGADSGLRDQLVVAGRIYSTWRYLSCDAAAFLVTSGVAADTSNICGPFVYDQDSDGALVPAQLVWNYTAASTNPPALRLRTGNTLTGANGGDGAGIRTGINFFAASSSPVMEAWVRAVTVTGTMIYTVGFTDYSISTGDISGSAPPTHGVYFTASTSNNWFAVMRTQAGGETRIDTGVATSTTNFQKLRIELTPSQALFLIDGVVVAGFTSNIPSVNLGMVVAVGIPDTTNAERNLDFSLIRLWTDDPPAFPSDEEGLSALQVAAHVPGQSVTPSENYISGASVGVWYQPEAPDSLSGGMLAALSPGSTTSTIRVGPTTQPYQSDMLGVIVPYPHTALGEHHQESVPVAASGRAEVNVNNEGGDIKPGDYLTASSERGTAMKANKAGYVIGKALTGLDGKRSGAVVVQVSPMYYSGSSLKRFASGLLIESEPSSRELLNQFIVGAAAESASGTSHRSEFFTDRIASAFDITTPQITARALTVDTIGPGTEGEIEVRLAQNGVFTFTDTAASTTVATIDHAGNATFAGTLRVARLEADEMIGLELLETRLAAVEGGLSTLADVQTSLTAVQTGLVTAETRLNEQQALIESLLQAHVEPDEAPAFDISLITDAESIQIEGPVTLNGGLHVNSLRSVEGSINIWSDVIFFGRPYFTSDMGGIAIVREGAQYVDVVFESEYLELPIVNATMSFDAPAEISAEDESAISSDEQEIFDEDVRFYVTRKATTGFRIVLDKPASADISFNWIAIAVRDARTVYGGDEEVVPTPDPSPLPSPAAEENEASAEEPSEEPVVELPDAPESAELSTPPGESDPSASAPTPAEEISAPDAPSAPQSPDASENSSVPEPPAVEVSETPAEPSAPVVPDAAPAPAAPEAPSSDTGGSADI